MATATLHLFKRLNHMYWPIFATSALINLTPFVNTLMMGRLGPEFLAAGGLVNSCFIFMMVLFWGIFTSVSTLISRYRGAEDEVAISKVFKSALTLALILSMIMVLVFMHLDRILIWAHQPEAIVVLAKPYIMILSLVIIPDFILTVLLDFFFGIGKPRIAMLASMLLVPLNIGCNYIFMYGKLGMPALGITGLGVGMLIAYTTIMLVLSLFIILNANFNIYLKQASWFEKIYIKELLSVGIPVGLIWVAEWGFFTIIAFLMGAISIVALAAYQIAFQIDLLLFTFTHNMGNTLQILIGENIGKKNYQDLSRIYWLAFSFLGSFLLIASGIIWSMPTYIAHWALGSNFNLQNPTSILTLALLKLMPIFLLLDSAGYLSFSALRGFKDTRFSLGVVILVYWISVVPVLIVGIVHLKIFTPEEVWLLLCTGSLLSFILQFLRLRWRMNSIKY